MLKLSTVEDITGNCITLSNSTMFQGMFCNKLVAAVVFFVLFYTKKII